MINLERSGLAAADLQAEHTNDRRAQGESSAGAERQPENTPQAEEWGRSGKRDVRRLLATIQSLDDEREIPAIVEDWLYKCMPSEMATEAGRRFHLEQNITMMFLIHEKTMEQRLQREHTFKLMCRTAIVGVTVLMPLVAYLYANEYISTLWPGLFWSCVAVFAVLLFVAYQVVLYLLTHPDARDRFFAFFGIQEADDDDT